MQTNFMNKFTTVAIKKKKKKDFNTFKTSHKKFPESHHLDIQ